MQTLNRAALERSLQQSLGFSLLLLILLSSVLTWDPSRCPCLSQSLREPGADPVHTASCYVVDWREPALPSLSLLFLSLNIGQGKKEKELKYLCSYFTLVIRTTTIPTMNRSSGYTLLIEETEVKRDSTIGWGGSLLHVMRMCGISTAHPVAHVCNPSVSTA